jgi:L-threonylcarbamoyladenylate synthase
MAFSQAIKRAARILRSGGVVAYPTEGVFGLGCLPDNFAAVSRVLAIKERDPALGLVLIAADIEQLAGWIELPVGTSQLKSTGNKPVTWIIPATDEVPYWIRGEHAGLAVRITTHPIAAALC